MSHKNWNLSNFWQKFYHQTALMITKSCDQDPGDNSTANDACCHTWKTELYSQDPWSRREVVPWPQHVYHHKSPTWTTWCTGLQSNDVLGLFCSAGFPHPPNCITFDYLLYCFLWVLFWISSYMIFCLIFCFDILSISQSVTLKFVPPV